jgi:hypothetical protein
MVVVRISNRGLACVEGDSNARELRAESVREALVVQGRRHELPKLGIRRRGPSSQHLEGGHAETHRDRAEPHTDGFDEGFAPRIPCRGSRGIARTREGLVQPLHHGSGIVKSAEPRFASQRADDGSPVKIAIHPRVDLGDQPIARPCADSSQGIDHAVSHAKAQVVCASMKLRDDLSAAALVVRRSSPKRANPANRKKLEGGGSGRFFLVEPGQSEDHAVCPGASRSALLSEGIGERVVRTRPRQPRTSRQKGMESRGTTLDRLVESTPEGARSRLGHVGVP